MGEPSILSELKRRGVLKAGVLYCTASWVLLQAVDLVQEPLGLPGWALKATIVAVSLGFPLALAASWYFDLTLTGFVRTEDAAATEPELHPGITDKWLWLGLGAGLLLGVGIVQVWRSHTDPGLVPSASLEAFNKASRDLGAARQIRDPSIRRDSASSAAIQLEAIVDEVPSWPRAWGALAEAYSLLAESPGESFLDRREAAREALAEALALAPEDPEVLVRRARFLIELDDDPAGATALLRPLFEHDPRASAIASLLTQALADQGLWSEREMLAARWHRAAPDSVEALLARAEALVALAHYDEAALVYEQAAKLQREPEIDVALERALIPLHDRGDLAAVDAALVAQQDRFATRWRWTRVRAAVAMLLGDPNEAARLVEGSRADDWPVGERDFLRAVAAHAKGDPAAVRSAGARAMAILEAASDNGLRPRTLAERLAYRAHLHCLSDDRSRGSAMLASAEVLLRVEDASAPGIALRHTFAQAWRACGEIGRSDQHVAWLAEHPTPRSSARTVALITAVPP